jgi:hypothetical protein
MKIKGVPVWQLVLGAITLPTLVVLAFIFPKIAKLIILVSMLVVGLVVLGWFGILVVFSIHGIEIGDEDEY